MNYNVIALPKFSTQLKKLAKKYKKIKIDLQQITQHLPYVYLLQNSKR